MPEKQLFWNDAKGNRYSTRITIGDAMRLKEASCDLMDGEFLKSLFGDPLKLIETIAEAARSQWEATLSYTQFADLVTESEETYINARKAFQAGVEDFFRRTNQAAYANLVLAGVEAAETAQAMMAERVKGDRMQGLMGQALDKIGRDFDELIEEQLNQIKHGG